MSLEKHEMLKFIAVFILLTVVLCCVCYCSPLSYKEDDVIEVTTTPKVYKDRFIYKNQHKTIPQNKTDTSFSGRIQPLQSNLRETKKEYESEKNFKVKSVMPGEKTLRQSDDDDDDDDDDGGEYEGIDYNPDDKTGGKKLQQQCKPDSSQEKVADAVAVPMMIIHEMDMVAMQIPMKEPQGAQREQEWSEWSACSRPCRNGKGLQRRWRLQPGEHDKEQQFRPCYLADCEARDFHFRPSLF